jgi:hypothetical protein
MKGVVFTEFLEMVEQKFSADMVDDIIDAADLPSGGAYTAVGTYSHEEIVALVVALSKRTGAQIPDLLGTFGRYLFGRFAVTYPDLVDRSLGAFGFLAGIEDVIHAEVRKLYPDAQLPTFEVERHDEKELVLIYKSIRHFEDLAEGLIHGCLMHFGERVCVVRQTQGDGIDRAERFVLTREG